MKKSIRKIIIQLIIILVILCLPTAIIYFTTQSGDSIQDREMIIKVNKDNIEVQDTFNLGFSEKTTEINLKNIIGIRYKDSIESLKIENKVVENWNYRIKNTSGENTSKDIQVNYLMQENHINKYTDLACLKVNLCPFNIDLAENINITVQFDEPTQIFEVENGRSITTEKISDAEYKLHIDKIKKLQDNYISVLFDNTLINVGKVQNESYREQDEIERQQFLEVSKYIPVLFISAILMIFCYITYFIFIGKRQKVHQLRREWEGLISPVLAETIVDGKIGVKELIMNVVIDLVTRGNIEVINNESIRLIHKDNLEKYEEKIISMLFEKKQQIHFYDFKDIFVKINSKTKEIYSDIKEIKDNIIAELINKEILSYKKNKIINILRLILGINIFIIIFTMAGLMSSIDIFIYFGIMIMSVVIIFASKKRTFFESMDKINNARNSMKFKLSIIMLLIMIVIGILWNTDKVPIENLLFVIIIILDIIFVMKTKKQFLTQKGKEERRKILELKNYLEEYSIIEERDLQDVILWDKYLAYATAFGIPNKITSKVYEDYMNANIALQMIEKIVKIF